VRRFILFMVVASVLVGVLPSTAAASGWLVKDGAGKSLGRVVKVDRRNCEVYLKSGEYYGAVTWGSTLWLAKQGSKDSTVTGKMAFVSNGDSNSWDITNVDPFGTDGSARKSGGVWKVYKGSSGKVRARIPGSCPGWMAAGAGFILSSAWPTS
jgi:hypothetical protein